MYNLSSEIRIYNELAETIPVNAMARLALGQHDIYNKHFSVLKPNADNMDWSELISIPYSVLSGKKGIGYTGSIFTALSKPGEALVYGDKVGTEAGQWWLRKITDDSYGINEGQFLVVQGPTLPADWQINTLYNPGSTVKDGWMMYGCIAAHISDSGAPWYNRPGGGSNWQMFWQYTESFQIIVRPRISGRFFGHYG